MGEPPPKETASQRPQGDRISSPGPVGGEKKPSGAPSGAHAAASAKLPSAPPLEPRHAPSLPPRASSTPPPVPTAGARDEDPLLGTVLLDRVRVERPLARGGMGKVYYGELVRMKRPCAVKVLDARLAAGGDAADFTRRFLLEASIAAKLTHPNVVTIFDYGETADGSCFIAMELLDGKSLSDELKASGPLPAERAIHITRQVARALREAHTLGVVHRDMKPGNVYLVSRDDDDDFVKVLDFGLVKETSAGEGQDHTQIGQIMGSPRYMAPEQVQGKAVDGRTDIYAVGATLYAMLAGRPPFDKATDLATMMAQVSDAPPPIASVAPDALLPLGLEAVVMKCLAKNPDERFSSMEELIAALKLRPGQQTTTSDSGSNSAPRLMPPVISVQPSPPRRSAMPWVVALGVAATLGLAVTLLSRQDEAPPAPGQAPAVSALPPVPPPAPPSTPPPAPAVTSTLHVETDPPGAKVKEEGDVMCEATPCDIVYTGEKADPTYEHLLTFLKSDYKLEVGASPISLKMTRAR
jgi:serine/threonine protein kinase